MFCLNKAYLFILFNKNNFFSLKVIIMKFVYHKNAKLFFAKTCFIFNFYKKYCKKLINKIN